jgi:hypothetical protein
MTHVSIFVWKKDMTAYRDFIHDYPSRCRRLLDEHFKNAQRNDLEVTLLLSVASSGLIVPYARLSEDAHPARDADRFAEAKTNLDELLDDDFLDSKLWDTTDPKSWRFGELRDLSGDPDAWHLDELKPVSGRKKARSIVKVLRNALAHGNVFTRGRPHIDRLVFLSRRCQDNPERGYNCVVVSPADLKRFVLNWLETLGGVEVGKWVFVEGKLLERSVA